MTAALASVQWNLGWMHDSLDYFMRDPVARRWHHDELTFGLLYAFSENSSCRCPMTKSCMANIRSSAACPATIGKKFASLRAYYAFMWAYPGKKLLFMGRNSGRWLNGTSTVNSTGILLNRPWHRGVRDCVRDLNRLYRAEPAMHARDCEQGGFRWIVRR